MRMTTKCLCKTLQLFLDQHYLGRLLLLVSKMAVLLLIHHTRTW